MSGELAGICTSGLSAMSFYFLILGCARPWLLRAGFLSWWCVGSSLWWLLLWSAGSGCAGLLQQLQHAGSEVAALRL